MSIEQRIQSHFADSAAAKQRTLDAQLPAIAAAVHRLADALRAGGKVLVCGNGGSAADAQHFAAELSGRFERERPGLAGIALTTDTSALTAIGNDYGFDDVFARQVRALGARGDVAIAISTSGRSPNVLRAVEAARDAGLKVVALTGGDGGALATAADVTLRVSASTLSARIQETHILVGHVICELVDRR
ncbi:MAG TPA: D-sedoheptulose 7-phosphate isomerase, partial [Methylibium sp.]|nr:D-sedoheptulose 7-phosphate isomerase [Methylibium sp.]